MYSIATQRIKKELTEFEELSASECSIKVYSIGDSYTNLRGEIAGPPDTPYEGGTFLLKINVPEAYPFKPPQVRFMTKIWHPNISPSSNGTISSDIFNDDEWSSATTLRSLLLYLQALLANVEQGNLQDAAVTRQYKKHPELFAKTASHWTNVYAGGPCKNTKFDTKIQRLMDMGIECDQARRSLSSHNWNFKQARDQLLNL